MMTACLNFTLTCQIILFNYICNIKESVFGFRWGEEFDRNLTAADSVIELGYFQMGALISFLPQNQKYSCNIHVSARNIMKSAPWLRNKD